MTLLLDGLQGWVESLLGRFNYIGPFVVLLLCGVGLPLPEEVTLIGSGLLLHRGEVEFVPIVAVCALAILMGDAIPFALGRWQGDALLEKRWLRRLLHPQRLRLLRRRFAEHGNWAVFTCRFLPGVRLPGYFTAGTLGMSWLRFLFLDLLGVLLSVPLSIWLGKLFGESIERLERRVEGLHLLLGFGVVSLLLILFVRSLLAARAARERRMESLAASAAAAAPAPNSDASSSGGAPRGEPPAPIRGSRAGTVDGRGGEAHSGAPPRSGSD